MARLEYRRGSSDKFYEGYIAALVPVNGRIVAIHMQSINILLMASHYPRGGDGWVSQLGLIAGVGLDQASAHNSRHGLGLTSADFSAQIMMGLRVGAQFVAMTRWGRIGTIGQQKLLVSYAAQTTDYIAVSACIRAIEEKLMEKASKGYHYVAQEQMTTYHLLHPAKLITYGLMPATEASIREAQLQDAAVQVKQAQQAERELTDALNRVSSIVEPTGVANAWLI
jgi:predicted DNA-binding WGR domain protein